MTGHDYDQLMYEYVCAGCGAQWGERRQISHTDDCLVAQGIDEAADLDRQWFEEHPHANRYHRPISAAELAEFSALGWIGMHPGWRVEVSQIEPGLRRRHPYGSAAGQLNQQEDGS